MKDDKQIRAGEWLEEIDSAFKHLNECRRRAASLHTRGVNRDSLNRDWFHSDRIAQRLEADMELAQAQDEIARLELRAATLTGLATLQAALSFPDDAMFG